MGCETTAPCDTSFKARRIEISLLTYLIAYSTETAVIAVHNDIVRAVDQGHVAALVLDLSAAFDTVDHSTLLCLLQSRFSISGQCLAWSQSYLYGRTEVFTTSTNYSAPIPLATGVPQGSVLGPIQFVVYIYTTDISDTFFCS